MESQSAQQSVHIERFRRYAKGALEPSVIPLPPSEMPPTALASGGLMGAIVVRQPVGVVACITPYNFPIVNMAGKLGPALATGNTVVVRPASQDPLAVIELENQASADRIGYSLWKVLCVRAPLRMVFCYRKEQAEVSALMRDLSHHVIASLALTERADLEGETLVIVGSRGNADTFPYGFFHWWELNRTTGKFERM